MKTLLRFYFLACALSWVIWLPLYLPYFGNDSLPAFKYQHAFGAWGPMLAAFIVTGAEQGRSGIKALARRMIGVNHTGLLLVAVISPFILMGIASAIHYIVSGVRPNFSSVGQTSEFPYFSFAAYFLYNVIFFGFGEETGWKGVMLPRLQQRFTALTSSVLFTFFWAVWHIPLFLYRPGYTAMEGAGIAGWFFSLLTGSILLTWLFNSSKGSILVCALFHAAIDIAFVSDAVDLTLVNYMGMLITIWGVVTILVFGYRHLSRNSRITGLK